MKFSCWIDFLATSMRLTVGGDQDPYYLPDHNVCIALPSAESCSQLSAVLDDLRL